jgi:hypothetical protein
MKRYQVKFAIIMHLTKKFFFLDPVYEEIEMSHNKISVGVNEAYGHVTKTQ